MTICTPIGGAHTWKRKHYCCTWIHHVHYVVNTKADIVLAATPLLGKCARCLISYSGATDKVNEMLGLSFYCKSVNNHLMT